MAIVLVLVLVLAAQEAPVWVVLVDFEVAAVVLVVAAVALVLAAVVVLADAAPHEFDQQHHASPIFAEFPATRNDGKSTPSNVG